MGFINEMFEGYSFRTIDYERNIILRKVGGGGPQETINFELHINEEIIKFSAFRYVRPYKKMNDYVLWKIMSFSPASKKEKYYIDVVVEALNTYGFASSTRGINKIDIEFDKLLNISGEV